MKKTWTRRDLLRLSAAAAGAPLLMTPGCVSSSPASQPGRKPNIIYILADDLGYGDLSCYGQTRFETPNIDRLASEGMKFTDHYAGSTVCAPSRCSLMTGYHTGRAHVRGNWERGPHGVGAGLPLRPEDLTVAELLKSAGYTTGLYGKWGLGVQETTGEPAKKGFDRWFGYLNQWNAHFFYPTSLLRDGEVVPLEENADGGRQTYSHDLITEEALQFVRDNAENPFFLYLAYTIPHAEMLVPEDSMAPFVGKYPETPYVGTHYSSQPTPRAAFAGMVTRMDRDVGRLLQLLQELGIDEDTIIFFSSDNGPHREGGHDPEFFQSAGPFRGIKRDLYEGGVRVPFLARWPGQIEPGSESAHVSAFWDFLPTSAELAGAQPPSGLDGISFLPALRGQEQKEHDYLYWEFHERAASTQAIRFGDWKVFSPGPGRPLELYDLKSDPGEEKDLAGQHPQVVARAREILAGARTPHEVWELKTGD
jgi:arylsulfatase A